MMTKLPDYPQFLERYFPKDENGHEMINLAFYFGFRFPDGMRAQFRNRAIRVCAEYWDLCGQHLKWRTTPVKSAWKKIPPDYDIGNWQNELALAVFKKFRPASLPPASDKEAALAAMEGSFPEALSEASWIARFPHLDWAWEMDFHSGQSANEAAQFKISALGDSTQTGGYSHLYLYLPVEWFAENPQHDPVSLFKHWAWLMQAHFGTAGLGLVPATYLPSMGKTSGLAAAFAQQFPGVELADPLGQHNAFSGLLSANWLNLIDDQLVARLGGIDAIKAQLAQDAYGHLTGLHPFDGGLILSSGESPQLLEAGQAGMAPHAYGPVARLLKPLRSTEPWGSWGCPGEQNLAWLARLDH